MKKAFRVLLAILSIIVIGVTALITYVKTALPNVGPAQDIKVEVTPERVAKGKYLANHVAVCVDCHSQRDWSYYAGPIKDGTFGMGGELFGPEMGFPGTLYSKNITPYGIHSWTDGEVLRAITTGESKNGSALFPLMAYPAYSQMDKEDIYSIIAYLRSLPEVKNDVPARALDFPVNILVNTMPAKASFGDKPDTSNILAYGKYMTSIANCIECHSRVDKGKRIAGTEFGGGREFPFPNHTAVYTANITPDKETGIGNWTKELFIRKFKQYTDSSYRKQQVKPEDFNTIMPWLMYGGMEEKDLAAIYTYLQTVKPIHNTVIKFVKKS